MTYITDPIARYGLMEFDTMKDFVKYLNVSTIKPEHIIHVRRTQKSFLHKSRIQVLWYYDKPSTQQEKISVKNN